MTDFAPQNHCHWLIDQLQSSGEEVFFGLSSLDSPSLMGPCQVPSSSIAAGASKSFLLVQIWPQNFKMRLGIYLFGSNISVDVLYLLEVDECTQLINSV